MKAPTNKIINFERISLVLLFCFSFFIFWITSAGDTPYNYFTRLADAFLHGRLYMTTAPSWLSELIPAGNGKWFVPYSPMPAIVSLPFVFLFGAEFPQQLIAHLLGAGSVVVSFVIAKTLNQKQSKLPLWIAILTSVGTILWYESSTGSSWFLGQITCVFFMFLAILFSLQKRSFWAGVSLSACYLSRVHSIFALPVFLYILLADTNKKVKPLLLFFCGLAIGGVFSVWYNMMRFGVPWDKGYLLIPGVLNEPWFSKGIENISYIPRNLKAVFWSFPITTNSFPFIKPSWNGLSIWITTPAFLFAFFASYKKRLVQIIWLCILAIFVFVLSHGSNGFAQFGYRFAIDFYPLLTLLIILGFKDKKPTKMMWILLFIGVCVNLWGVLWINKFDWVSF